MRDCAGFCAAGLQLAGVSRGFVDLFESYAAQSKRSPRIAFSNEKG
jgi:hypothetical protein